VLRGHFVKRGEYVTNQLKSARESAGLTQAEAAQIVRIPYRTYQRWEANERLLSVDKFFRALKALQEAK
jgi:transcriptional regulator with XRE-family HTH domain